MNCIIIDLLQQHLQQQQQQQKIILNLVLYISL